MTTSVRRRTLLKAGAASALPLFSIASHAQSWPQRPIKFIAGYPPGGQTDLFARTFGEYISQKTGLQVVLESKVGVGGALALADLKRADPDGHTFVFTNSTTVIPNRRTYKSLPYEFEKDFRLVSIIPAGSLPSLASLRSGANNIKQFVELNNEFGLNMEAVQFKGEAPMWTDLGGNVVDLGPAVMVLRRRSSRPARASRLRSRANVLG